MCWVKNNKINMYALKTKTENLQKNPGMLYVWTAC